MKEKEEFENKEIKQIRRELRESRKNSIKINEYFEIQADPNPKRKEKRYEEFCKKYGYRKDLPMKLELHSDKDKARKIRMIYS